MVLSSRFLPYVFFCIQTKVSVIFVNLMLGHEPKIQVMSVEDTTQLLKKKKVVPFLPPTCVDWSCMEDLQTKSSNDVGLRHNYYQTSFAIQQLDL